MAALIPRAIAVQGIGFGARFVALQGFVLFDDQSNAGGADDGEDGRIAYIQQAESRRLTRVKANNQLIMVIAAAVVHGLMKPRNQK